MRHRWKSSSHLGCSRNNGSDHSKYFPPNINLPQVSPHLTTPAGIRTQSAKLLGKPQPPSLPRSNLLDSELLPEPATLLDPEEGGGGVVEGAGEGDHLPQDRGGEGPREARLSDQVETRHCHARLFRLHQVSILVSKLWAVYFSPDRSWLHCLKVGSWTLLYWNLNA